MNSTNSSTLLPRVLGVWVASAVVVGTVIGSGVFKKGQKVAENIPEFGLAMIAWVLVGVVTLFGALVLAEIAVLFPRAGGNYLFLKEGYGRLFGFLWGWVEFWIIRPASIAALATIFTEGLHDILKQTTGHEEVLAFWPRQLSTCGLILVLGIVNALGTRVGGGVQLAITIVKVGSLIGIMLLPFVILLFVDRPEFVPTTANMRPFWPDDWGKVNWGKFGVALVAVLWAYDGWRNIGPIAEEIKHPQRNIPLALLGGVAVLIAIYVGVNAAYYLVIPHDQMAKLSNTTVATEFCLRLIGPVGAMLASAAVMTSVLGSANGNVLVGPRLLFAMARDRMAPAGLTKLDPRTNTPVIAIGLVVAWAIGLVLLFGILHELQIEVKDPFDSLTDFAVFGAAGLEILVIGSIFVFRQKYPLDRFPRAYRCIGYPVVPIIYMIIMFAVLVNMFIQPTQRTEALIGLGFIVVGAAVYGLVFVAGSKAKKRKRRKRRR